MINPNDNGIIISVSLDDGFSSVKLSHIVDRTEEFIDIYTLMNDLIVPALIAMGYSEKTIKEVIKERGEN